MLLKNSKIIVIKIGSSLLVDNLSKSSPSSGNFSPTAVFKLSICDFVQNLIQLN